LKISRWRKEELQSASDKNSDSSLDHDDHNSDGDDWNVTLNDKAAKIADSDEERESDGDFINENDIIVFPDDLD
jgi:hypothetical protein